MQISELNAFYQQNESLLLSLIMVSLVVFIATLVAVPWMVVRIPADYFANPERASLAWKRRHPLVRLLFLLGKNLLGGLLFLLGITMLVLPGQGLLTILIGILLLDFPGKFRFECWLIQLPPVLRPVNWLRERRGRAPLRFA